MFMQMTTSLHMVEQQLENHCNCINLLCQPNIFEQENNQ